MDRLECFEHCSVGQAQILCKKTCREVLTFKHQNTYPTCPICLRAYHPEQTRCSGIGSQPGSGTLENHLSAEGSGMIQSIVLNKHPIPSFPHSHPQGQSLGDWKSPCWMCPVQVFPSAGPTMPLALRTHLHSSISNVQWPRLMTGE